MGSVAGTNWSVYYLQLRLMFQDGRIKLHKIENWDDQLSQQTFEDYLKIDRNWSTYSELAEYHILKRWK